MKNLEEVTPGSASAFLQQPKPHFFLPSTDHSSSVASPHLSRRPTIVLLENAAKHSEFIQEFISQPNRRLKRAYLLPDSIITRGHADANVYATTTDTDVDSISSRPTSVTADYETEVASEFSDFSKHIPMDEIAIQVEREGTLVYDFIHHLPNFTFIDKEGEYDATGVLAYDAACIHNEIPPVGIVKRKLNKGSTMDLDDYGIGDKGAWSLAVALVINTKITELSLSNNNLGTSGSQPIFKMLKENSAITHVTLRNNDLSGKPVEAFSEVLKFSTTLEYVDLSSNGLRDCDMVTISEAIAHNESLKSLNLSENDIYGSGKYWKAFFETNIFLHHLNLSWNKIRPPGSSAIARGIKHNNNIQTLNLSWNGFGTEGSQAIAASLRYNDCMTTLDLSSNRIGKEGFLALIGALALNAKLNVLRVGRNPIGREAGMEAMTFLQKNINKISIETIDLSEILFNTQFINEVNKIRQVRENFHVICGYTDSYGKRKMKSYDPVEDAVSFLRQYVTDNNISLVELFQELDDDGSMSVTYDEFKIGLKKAGVPVSNEQIECLIKAFDSDGDGEIDFSEFVLGTDEYEHHDEPK